MLSLKNAETNAIVAVLNDVDFGSRLGELRARIKSELPNINEAYEFTICGTGISSKQEAKYDIQKCATKFGREGDFFIPLHFLPHENIARVELLKKETVKQKVSESVESEIKSNKAVPRKERKIYPNYFSQEEIDSSLDEFEKQRKIFSNNKLTEIIESSSLKEWNLQEIRGVINVHWVLRKTEILKNSVLELTANLTATGEFYDSSKHHENPGQIEKNLLKNLDILEKAQFMVDKHYKQLSEDLAKNGEESRPRLEKQFDQIFSELKIAQGNLAKSIAEYKNMQATEAGKLLSKEDINDDDLMAWNDINEECFHLSLSESEMEEIASSVKDSIDQ